MTFTLENERPVNTTIFNVPGFQSLPKRIKQMLVATEAHLFDQPAPRQSLRFSEPWDLRADRTLATFLADWRQVLSSGRAMSSLE